MENLVHLLAGILLAIVAAAHFIRLFRPYKLSLGKYDIPLWVSGVAFIITGSLAVFLLRMLSY